MSNVDRYLLADIFPRPRARQTAPKRLPAQRMIHGLQRVFRGCYRTPDGVGRVEKNGREWDAWRTDVPGITAHYDTLREAAQYALHGYAEGE